MRAAPLTQRIFAGVLDTMIQYAAESRAKSPSLEATLLRTLVSSFSYALKAYQMRAKTGGQTFEHVVLLEAAVQGWYVFTPVYFLSSPALLKHACTGGIMSGHLSSGVGDTA